MVSKDPKVFAYNIDLFVQNGSIPDGPHPAIKMPAWGAKKLLKQQDIADIIAYIISLNTAK
jgi:mono/diheme cytochrome c family protein